MAHSLVCPFFFLVQNLIMRLLFALSCLSLF
nr:MAG TPA: hypothetical protein [Caudoviricetes sp.]